MNLRRALLLFVLVAAIALAGTACGVRKVQRPISAAKVGAETGWKPMTPIHVRKGDKLVILVGNLTTKEHGFSIDAFRVRKTVKPGRHTSVRFTPTRTGHFTIYCQLHPAHLKTELNVT